MAITINGDGSIGGLNTITNLDAGGLPDGSVTADDLATDSVTTAKIEDSAVTTAKITDANITAAKLDGAQSGSAPIYGARAWVNFDGTGAIGANQTIRGSGNVTSVYKNSTGNYTITFTTAMPDANYAVSMLPSSTPAGGYAFADVSSLQSSEVRVTLFGNYPSGSAVASDSTVVCVTVFR